MLSISPHSRTHACTHARLACLTLVSSCGWLPVFGTNDWQADLALLVDVGVVDFRFEGDPGGLERVFSRKDELHPKCSLVVRRGILGREGGKYQCCTQRSTKVAGVLPSTLYLTLCQANATSFGRPPSTYWNDIPLPGEHVCFIHLNAAEVLNGRFLNVLKLLYTRKDKIV